MQALKAIVIIMGVLIVVGVAVVVVTIYNRMNRMGDTAPSATATAPAPVPYTPRQLAAFGDVPVAIPDGCRVVEMVPAGERLLLRLGSVARCNRILVIDLGTGARLGSIELAAPE